jgi:hypothetical protein
MRYCIIVYFPYSQNSSGKSKKEISLKKNMFLNTCLKRTHVLYMCCSCQPKIVIIISKYGNLWFF